MARSSLAVIAALLLSGCAASATLYPTNGAAKSGGVLRERFTEFSTGNGPVRVTMPDGEVLTGQYSATLGRPTRPESPLTSIYNANGVATRSALPRMTVSEAASPAIADFAGPKGTTMRCQVFNNNSTGHGAGTCETSTGAKYRLQY